jgi:hypothetical protein
MEMLNLVFIEEQDSKTSTDVVKSPGKLQTTIMGWIQWEMKFVNYLMSLKDKQMVPLAYVVRKEPAPENLNEANRKLYRVALVGELFNEDNTKVYLALKDLVLLTEGYEKIKALDSTHNGRGAMMALRAHYDGGSAATKRLAYANQVIKEFHYKTEQAQRHSRLIHTYIN